VSVPPAIADQMCAQMKRDYIEFSDRSSPVGYLLTFRRYGTWLHGDQRGSIDRNHRQYGTPMLPPSRRREIHDIRLMKQPPVKLNRLRRRAVETSIRDTCTLRRWRLWTLNVRTTHVHAVVSSNNNPSAILTALKANATRSMRENQCWLSGLSPWARGGSKKYLWDEQELIQAIEYVEGGQGGALKN
jgi:REP element-mobilizing transposase RayT